MLFKPLLAILVSFVLMLGSASALPGKKDYRYRGCRLFNRCHGKEEVLPRDVGVEEAANSAYLPDCFGHWSARDCPYQPPHHRRDVAKPSSWRKVRCLVHHDREHCAESGNLIPRDVGVNDQLYCGLRPGHHRCPGMGLGVNDMPPRPRQENKGKGGRTDSEES